MDDTKRSTSEGFQSSQSDRNLKTSATKNAKKSSFGRKPATSPSDDDDVLLNLPAGLKYRMPGKRQRVVLGSLVIGLNVLLVIAVLLYFYSPDFQEFIYNVGRN